MSNLVRDGDRFHEYVQQQFVQTSEQQMDFGFAGLMAQQDSLEHLVGVVQEDAVPAVGR